MKCKQCSNELTGKQTQFCSKKCNMANRRSATVTEPTVTVSKCVTAKQGDVVTDDWWGEGLDDLPAGVVRPLGIPSNECETMTGQALSSRVSSYKGLAWIDSPEYAELIWRLLNHTADELQASGQMIPVWKAA